MRFIFCFLYLKKNSHNNWNLSHIQFTHTYGNQLKNNNGEGKITILFHLYDSFSMLSPPKVVSAVCLTKTETASWTLVLIAVSSQKGRHDQHPLGLNKCLMQPTWSTSKYPYIHFQGCHVNEAESQRHVKQLCRFRTMWLLARVVQAGEEPVTSKKQDLQTIPSLRALITLWAFIPHNCGANTRFKIYSGLQEADDAHSFWRTADAAQNSVSLSRPANVSGILCKSFWSL